MPPTEREPTEGEPEAATAPSAEAVTLSVAVRAVRSAADRELGSDARILVVVPDGGELTIGEPLEGRPCARTLTVGESEARHVLDGLLDARDRNGERFHVVVLARGEMPRFARDVRSEARRRGRLALIAIREGSQPLDEKALASRLVSYAKTADTGSNVEPDHEWLDEFDDETLDHPAEWGGDGIDETLLDLLEREPRATLIAESDATTLAKTAAAHPDRTLVVPTIQSSDLLRCLGEALGGGRPIVVLNQRSLGRMRGTLRFAANSELTLDVVVPVEDGSNADRYVADLAPVIVRSSELETVLHAHERGLRCLVATEAIAPPISRRLHGPVPSLDTSEHVLQIEREAILDRSLSPEFEQWVERYERVGGRSRRLWQWAAHCLDFVVLDCVPTKWHSFLRDTKLLGVMLNALWDDVADRGAGLGALKTLLSVVEHGSRQDTIPAADERYVGFCDEVWIEYRRRLELLPGFERLGDLVDFDHRQLISTMYYSVLAKRDVGLLNPVEHDVYTPHNMMMTVFWTVDLLCSPPVPVTEAGPLREALWHGQCMGRIGNVLGTWEREVGERDHGNSVFARALAEGIVSEGELLTLDPGELETRIRNSHIEAEVANDWRTHRARIVDLVHRVPSIDLAKLVAGLDRLLCTELACRGLK